VREATFVYGPWSGDAVEIDQEDLVAVLPGDDPVDGAATS
jgi:hypothetical protein